MYIIKLISLSQVKYLPLTTFFVGTPFEVLSKTTLPYSSNARNPVGLLILAFSDLIEI